MSISDPPSAASSMSSVSGLPAVSQDLDIDPPTELEELTEKLVLVAAVRVAVVTLALGALFIYAQLRPSLISHQVADWQYILIGVTYGLSLFYALILRFSNPGLMRALAHIQTALDAVIVSVLVLMTGGVESVFTFAYFFTILGASMTLFRRGAFVATLFSVMTFGMTVLIQVYEVLPLMPSVRVGNAVFTYFMSSVGLTLVALLSSTLTERLRLVDRRLAEKRSDFERLEQLHAAILQSLPAGLVTVDSSGVIQYANDSALNILRMEWEEMAGRPLWDAVPSMGAGWNSRGREDGHSTLVRFEESFARSDGAVIRLGFSFAPLNLDSGPAVGSIVVFQDVTHIVRLKDAVERAERLASVGKFAAGLAHEVRNPLASMCASIDVLNQALEPPAGLQKLMNNVVKEADRLNGLITDFLALAKPRALSLEERDLGALVEGVVALFRNDKLVASCEIETELETGILLPIDEDRMRQVIWNLCRNAAEAMAEKGGKLMLCTKTVGREYVLSIVDTGPGVPEEQLKKVFDPFYTTKAGGSGLGLAIAHSIVEAHGAKINVESKQGEGTEVNIRFPIELGSADLITDNVELLSATPKTGAA